MVLRVTLLSLVLLRNAPDRRGVVDVQKPPDVGSNLAQIGAPVTKIEAEHVELLQPLEAAAGPPDVVVDEVTVQLQPKVRSDNVFSNVG
jgi:hypothetical protein